MNNKSKIKYVRPKAKLDDIVVIASPDGKDCKFAQAKITDAKQVLESDGSTYWLYTGIYLEDTSDLEFRVCLNDEEIIDVLK